MWLIQTISELFGLNNFIEFVIILITVIVGAYAKDYLRIISSSNKKGSTEKKIDMRRIFISACTGSIVAYTFSFYIKTKLGEQYLLLFSFVCGLIGFQLLEQLSTLDGIKSLLTDFFEFRRQKNNTDKKE